MIKNIIAYVVAILATIFTVFTLGKNTGKKEVIADKNQKAKELEDEINGLDDKHIHDIATSKWVRSKK